MPYDGSEARLEKGEFVQQRGWGQMLSGVPSAVLT